MPLNQPGKLSRKLKLLYTKDKNTSQSLKGMPGAKERVLELTTTPFKTVSRSDLSYKDKTTDGFVKPDGGPMSSMDRQGKESHTQGGASFYPDEQSEDNPSWHPE